MARRVSPPESTSTGFGVGVAKPIRKNGANFHIDEVVRCSKIPADGHSGRPAPDRRDLPPAFGNPLLQRAQLLSASSRGAKPTHSSQMVLPEERLLFWRKARVLSAREMVPPSGPSPYRMLSNVVFPAPLRPMRPIRSVSSMRALTRKTGRPHSFFNIFKRDDHRGSVPVSKVSYCYSGKGEILLRVPRQGGGDCALPSLYFYLFCCIHGLNGP